MNIAKEFYDAKASRDQARFAKACDLAERAGYIVSEGHLSEPANVRAVTLPEPAKAFGKAKNAD